MKRSIVLFAIAAFISVLAKTTATNSDDLMQARIVCMEHHNISDAEFESLNKQEEDNYDRKFKCFVHCLAEEMDYLDETGKISIEKIKKNLHMGDYQVVRMESCKEEYAGETDVCEYSYNVVTCYTKPMLVRHIK